MIIKTCNILITWMCVNCLDEYGPLKESSQNKTLEKKHQKSSKNKYANLFQK